MLVCVRVRACVCVWVCACVRAHVRVHVRVRACVPACLPAKRLSLGLIPPLLCREMIRKCSHKLSSCIPRREWVRRVTPCCSPLLCHRCSCHLPHPVWKRVTPVRPVGCGFLLFCGALCTHVYELCLHVNSCRYMLSVYMQSSVHMQCLSLPRDFE